MEKGTKKPICTYCHTEMEVDYDWTSDEDEWEDSRVFYYWKCKCKEDTLKAIYKKEKNKIL